MPGKLKPTAVTPKIPFYRYNVPKQTRVQSVRRRAPANYETYINIGHPIYFVANVEFLGLVYMYWLVRSVGSMIEL